MQDNTRRSGQEIMDEMDEMSLSKHERMVYISALGLSMATPGAEFVLNYKLIASVDNIDRAKVRRIVNRLGDMGLVELVEDNLYRAILKVK